MHAPKQNLRVIRAGLAALVGLVLSGCLLQPADETGSITLSIFAGGGVNAANVDVGTGFTTTSSATDARIWIFADGNLYEIGDAGFVNVRLENGRARVAIERIPAGRGYRVLVVMGVRDETSGTFVPVGFARTGRFAVRAGTESLVEATKNELSVAGIQKAQFRLLGAAWNGIAYGEAYAEEPESVLLTNSTSIRLESDPPQEVPEVDISNLFGEVIGLNRLSDMPSGTAAEVLISGSSAGGIFPIDGDISVVDFGGPVSDTVGRHVAEVNHYAVNGNGLLAFKLAGFSSDAALWTKLTPAELPAIQDGVPVAIDLAASDAEGNGGFYVATRAYGNMFISDTAISNAGGDASQLAAPILNRNTSTVRFFDVPYPGTNTALPITALATERIGAVAHLLVGTPRGAYVFPEATLTSGNTSLYDADSGLVNPNASSFRTLVPDVRVEHLAANFNGDIGTAFAVVSQHLLTVLHTTGSTLTTLVDGLPIYAVAPGEITDLDVTQQFGDPANEVRVLLSTTEGLVDLTIPIQ